MRSTTSPASRKPARILIVDDSAVMRALLRSVVSSDDRLEVAGAAADGASALRAMDSLQPDLVLLDVEMPVMDGLQTLKQMRAGRKRVPVIMCSSLTQRGAKVTIEALASGASDYVAKPTGQSSREAAIRSLAHDLVPKILALTANSAHDSAPAHSSAFPPAPGQSPFLTESQNFHPVSAPVVPQPSAVATPPAVVLIGVSTGGPAALDVLLPAIPAGFPLPILIVQHMPELFTKLLAERLNGRCPLRVCEASPGEPVRPGTIYIARGDWHMELAASDRLADRVSERSATIFSPSNTVLRLTQEAPENHCRPAADVLFRSGVAIYGSRVLGVVLTGMGYDGLAGSRIIREHGGTVLAQDQSTSAVWGMPGAVTQAGLANRVLPLHAIAPEILRLVSRSQRDAHDLRESVASGIGSVTH